VTKEHKGIISQSVIESIDGSTWEEPETKGQEFEIKIGNHQHAAFACPEMGRLLDAQKS